MTNFQRILALSWLVIAFGSGMIFEKESFLFKAMLFVITAVPFLLLWALSEIHELGKKIKELENRIYDLENRK